MVLLIFYWDNNISCKIQLFFYSSIELAIPVTLNNEIENKYSGDLHENETIIQ